MASSEIDVEPRPASPYKIYQGEGSDFDDVEDPEANDVALVDIPPWTPIEIFVTELAGVAVIILIITLAISANPFVMVTGVLGSVEGYCFRVDYPTLRSCLSRPHHRD